MINRISDKSSYAAIDPIFVQPPTHLSANEPFDAALSRAVNPASSNELSAREIEQRRRDRDDGVGERNAVGRDEPSSRTDRLRDREDRDDRSSRTDSREANDARDTPHRSREDSDTNATSESGKDGLSARNIGDQSNGDEGVEDAPGDESAVDGAEAALANVVEANVVEVVAVATGDDRGAADAESDGDTELSSIEDAIAERKALPVNKTVHADVERHQERVRQPSTLENDADLTSTVDAEKNPGDAAIDSTSAANIDGVLVDAVTEEAGAEVAADKAITHANSSVAASNPSTAVDVGAGIFAPASATGRSSEGSSGRETRSTARGVATKSERAVNAAGASNSAAQAVAAIAAEANASAPTENSTSADGSRTHQPSTGVADARAAAISTQREGNVADESGGQRGIVDRLTRGRSTGTARPEGTNAESEVQRVRLIQRVSRAFQTLSDGGGEVRLRLSPPSLGSIKLEVTMQAGTMSARIETETAAAKALLIDNLPALRERLATHDIKVSHFDIETSADSQQQNQFAQQDRAEDRPQRGSFREPQQRTPEPAQATVAARPLAPNGALDVLI